MSTFRVGLSQDIRRADGTLLIPELDLSPLDDDPRIECVPLPSTETLDGPTAASLDAAILMLEAVTDETFASGDRLAVLARFGVGYDRVQVSACTAHATALCIAPDGVRRPVAVAVITLMLALTSKLMVKDRITRRGPEGWAEKTRYNGVGLVGRTLGSLGIGNIGAEVFRMAKPFDMRFIAHDPYADPALARELGITLVALDDLFRDSDVLSVSCPLTEETRGIVSAERLALMKPGAFFINTSRGPVVDQAALTEALREQRIAGAGIDVLVDEPPDADEPILALDNVILAPHALCWTDQCMAGLGAADVAAVKAVMAGRAPTDVVNARVLEDPRFSRRLTRYGEAFG